MHKHKQIKTNAQTSIYKNRGKWTHKNTQVVYMTEKCRTGPGLEPRVFRLTYERSTS